MLVFLLGLTWPGIKASKVWVCFFVLCFRFTTEKNWNFHVSIYTSIRTNFRKCSVYLILRGALSSISSLFLLALKIWNRASNILFIGNNKADRKHENYSSKHRIGTQKISLSQLCLYLDSIFDQDQRWCTH